MKKILLFLCLICLLMLNITGCKDYLTEEELA